MSAWQPLPLKGTRRLFMTLLYSLRRRDLAILARRPKVIPITMCQGAVRSMHSMRGNLKTTLITAAFLPGDCR
jgi:hypothetical protein